jgi:sec-independent protein translocase protein TatA
MMLQGILPIGFFGVGDTEILVIMVVVLILFGGNKMPDFARGMGKTLRELRKATGDVEREFKKAMDEAENTLPKVDFPITGSSNSQPWSSPTIEPATTIIETTAFEAAPASTPVSTEVILPPKPSTSNPSIVKQTSEHEYHSDI